MKQLGEGVVEVWRAELGPCDLALLSPEERARAARFRFEADRGRWVAARTTLRYLLAHYLGLRPTAVRIAVGATGKPVVAELAFNVSHSGDLALYAFTSGRAVGVDVELIGRRRPDVLALAERAFGQEEAARLGRIAASMREHEFLRSWVRHEAALKCRGGRLGEDVAYDGLTLRELDIGPAAVAALAVEGPVREVRLSDLPAGWFGPKISDGESRPGGGRDSPKLSEP